MISSSNTNLSGELDEAPNLVFTQTAWGFFPAVRRQRVPDSTKGQWCRWAMSDSDKLNADFFF